MTVQKPVQLAVNEVAARMMDGLVSMQDLNDLAESKLKMNELRALFRDVYVKLKADRDDPISPSLAAKQLMDRMRAWAAAVQMT